MQHGNLLTLRSSLMPCSTLMTLSVLTASLVESTREMPEAGPASCVRVQKESGARVLMGGSACT